MKIKAYIYIISLLCFCFILASNTWSQQELVTGYYDPVNDWFVFEWDRPEYGRTTTIYDPANKVKPIIKAEVFFDTEAQDYIYNYEVTNQRGVKQHLLDVIVKYFTPIYDPIAPTPTKDWYMARFLGRADSWRWAKTGGKPSGIPPGQTERGLSFKSKGLPTVVDSFFLGHERAIYSPPGDYDTDEIIESFSRVFKELKEQYKDKFGSVVRKTVGPKTPPTPFVPIDFLNYIISLKHEAYNLSWIVQGRDDEKDKYEDEEKGIMKSLDKKLEKAKAELVKGDTKEAIEKLKSFIREVEALYKEGNEKEEKHEKEKEEHSHITSEAYALLKYNTIYLIEKLGGEWKDKNDKKD